MKHFNKHFMCQLKRNNKISTSSAQKYCLHCGTMKFKSEIEKNSQNPTKKLGFYLILTLKIKRFDPLRNLQRLVNGDTDEMTVKLMDIRNPFEKKESGFFKRTPERRTGEGWRRGTTVFLFGFYMFTWSTGNRFPTKLKLTVKIKTT